MRRSTVSERGKLVRWVASLLILGMLSACVPTQAGTSRSSFAVDATFADFYRQIGGGDTLGPAISSAFTNEGITYQYVVSGLMVYDPNQVALQRFHFSPLATSEWHINGQVEPAPSSADTAYMNGHRVWEEVSSFYSQFGADIIGFPLTGVQANDAKQRYEQYYEGLGFYRNYTDPPGKVHLMPYGAWMCGGECPYQAADSTPPRSSYTPQNSATEQIFGRVSEQLGYGFTGAPLAAPKLGSDGNYEMVYENVILFIDPASEGQIRLRPLPAMLGIEAEATGPEVKADWLAFFPIQDGLGFNIPNTFVTYIGDHGGVVYSGAPISEYTALADGGYSQCYTNLCLEYHPTAPLLLQTRLHPLGTEYLTLGENISTSGTTLSGALQINAWEDIPLIPSGESQGINIEATQENAPVSGMQFSLVVIQPNGITKTYTLAPTGLDGRTHIELDPINGPNGAIVQYKVCALGNVSPQICFTRSYTIWGQ